jgi:hypothetical protein
MINWTKDERVATLLLQARAHFDATGEFSLEHEAQMDKIREEYLRDLWNDYRSEDADAFDEWHCQPTVEDFINEEIEG